MSFTPYSVAVQSIGPNAVIGEPNNGDGGNADVFGPGGICQGTGPEAVAFAYDEECSQIASTDDLYIYFY